MQKVSKSFEMVREMVSFVNIRIAIKGNISNGKAMWNCIQIT